MGIVSIYAVKHQIKLYKKGAHMGAPSIKGLKLMFEVCFKGKILHSQQFYRNLRDITFFNKSLLSTQ